MSDISEHGAEDEGVGECHEYGRIHLIGRGEAIHTDEHFKWLEEPGILKLCGRGAEKLLPVFLYDDKYFVVPFGFSQKSFHIIYAHPATEYIVILFVVINTGRHLAHVKVIGQLLQPLACSEKLACLIVQKVLYAFVNLCNTVIQI